LEVDGDVVYMAIYVDQMGGSSRGVKNIQMMVILVIP